MELRDVIISGVTALVSGFVTWIFGIRRENSELKKSELDSVDKAVEIWRNTADELEKRLKAQIEELKREIEELKKSNSELKEENRQLRVEIRQLKKS